MYRLKSLSSLKANYYNQNINVIFLSEGYLNGDKKSFENSCIKFIDSLKNFSPFNLLKVYPIINFYSGFLPSKKQGIAIKGEGEKEKTVFGTEADIPNTKLSLDQEKIINIIDSIYIYENGEKIKINSILSQFELPGEFSRTIIVILCPRLKELNRGLSIEWFPQVGEYYFIATTLNGSWEQVIIRSLCKIFDLSDEKEILYSSNNGIDENYLIENSFFDDFSENIIHFDLKESENNWSDVRWKRLVPRYKWNEKVKINISNNEISQNSFYNPESIELWTNNKKEGPKIFRSSENCLMSFRIGESNRPINRTKIPLCNICENNIRGKIIHIGNLARN